MSTPNPMSGGRYEQQFPGGGLVWVDGPSSPPSQTGEYQPQGMGDAQVFRQSAPDEFVINTPEHVRSEPNPEGALPRGVYPQPQPPRGSGFKRENKPPPVVAATESPSPWMGSPSALPKFPNLRDRPNYNPGSRVPLGALWEQAMRNNHPADVDRKRLLMQFGLGMLGAGTGKAFFQALGEAGQGAFNYRDQAEKTNKDEAMRNALRQYEMDSRQQDMERKDYDTAFSNNVDSAEWANKETMGGYNASIPKYENIGDRSYEFKPGETPRALYQEPLKPQHPDDSRLGQASRLMQMEPKRFPTIEKALEALYPRGSAQPNSFSLDALRDSQGALP